MSLGRIILDCGRLRWNIIRRRVIAIANNLKQSQRQGANLLADTQYTDCSCVAFASIKYKLVLVLSWAQCTGVRRIAVWAKLPADPDVGDFVRLVEIVKVALAFESLMYDILVLRSDVAFVVGVVNRKKANMRI